MEMRKVTIYKKVKEEGETKKVVSGQGIFHEFGSDFIKYEYGPGNFSVGIIEMPDGRVRYIPLHLFTFDEPLTIGQGAQGNGNH